MIVKGFLKAHLAESALLALCVALAVCFACALASLASAYNAGVRRDLQRPDRRIITVEPGARAVPNGAAAAPAETETAEPRDFERLSTEEILDACPSLLEGWKEVRQTLSVAPGRKVEPGEADPVLDRVLARTVSAGFFAAYGLQAAEGSLFSQEDCDEERKVAVLGADLARRLYPDGKALGRSLLLAGSEYRIVGILKQDPSDVDPQGTNNMVFAPPITKLVVREGGSVMVMMTIPTLAFAAPDPTSLAAGIQELSSYLDKALGEGSYALRSSRDELLAEQVTANRLFGVVSLFAGLTLLVAAANILCLAVIRAARRRSVIAICRAMGSSVTRIFGALAGELLAAATAGALLGGALAALLTGLLGSTLAGGSRIGVDPVALIGALVASLAATAAFGAVPLWSAARRPPMEALRME